jgi:hypothetical protein
MCAQTMRNGILLLVAALTAFVLAIMLTGCGGQIAPSQNGQRGTETIVSPQLHVLDGTNLSVAPASLRGSGADATALSQLVAGDVLVSQQQGGFLRKVVRVSSDGADVVVDTEPAALDDALVQGALHASNDLLAATAPSVAGDRGAQSVVNVPPLVLNFANLPLFDYGAKGKLALNGTITLHPYLDVDLAFGGGRLQSFDLVMHGDIDAQLALQLTAGGELSQSFTQSLWTAPPVVLTQFIGPFPLVETISVELVATGEAHAGATGTLTLGGLDATAQLSAGAKFDGSNWSPVGTQTINLTPVQPSLAVNLQAGGSVSLQARVAVRFYDIAGPYLGVGPYARAEIASQNLAAPTATGRVGLNGDFGGDVSILGHRIAGFDVQLFDVGKDFSYTF